jgi:putative ABC transport system permease protein
VRKAVRAGVIPTLNSMLVMGVVSLPGMMTGQILAEVVPATA